jgi:hypothetical protein
MQYCKWDKDLLGGSWLFQSVMTHKLEANETVEYPMTSDDNRFDLGMLRGDQREVAAYILKRLKEWLNYVETYVESDMAEPFQPLRMTIVGAAGTGKTVLINCIVTAIRDIFGFTDAVLVFAPSGCAAFNAGGETVHYGCKVPVRSTKNSMEGRLSNKARDFLMKRLKRNIAVLFDERSMISLQTLGEAALNIAYTAHGGGHSDEQLGGIPVAILFGDDCQLPPPMAKGAFDILIDAGAAGTY